MQQLTLDTCIGKTVLVALSYFSATNELLKQSLLAGEVISADSEQGLTILLAASNNDVDAANNKTHHKSHNKQENKPQLIIPADFSCWFTAPKGSFHTSQKDIKIIDPNFLITWDIYQQQDKSIVDQDQQWWQWRPRQAPPSVG